MWSAKGSRLESRMKLTPAFQDSLPSARIFSYNDENERIGLLIKRIIPQKHFVNGQKDVFALFKKALASKRYGGDGNRDDTDGNELYQKDWMISPDSLPGKSTVPATIPTKDDDDKEIVLFGGSVKVQVPPPPSSCISDNMHTRVQNISSASSALPNRGSTFSSSGENNSRDTSGAGIWDAFKSNAPSKPAPRKRVRAAQTDENLDIRADQIQTNYAVAKPSQLPRLCEHKTLPTMPSTQSYTKEDFAGEKSSCVTQADR